MAWIRAENIAERMSDLRDATGWSQADLGERVDRVWQTVSDWERGERPPPRRVLVRLAREQGWDIEIFTEGGPMPSTVVNKPVNNRSEEEGKNVPPPPAHLEIKAYPPTIGTGPDPRTVRARRTADLLLGTANDAKTLMASGHLDDAEQTMWRGIQGAERELRGDEKRRPRVTRAEVDRRKRAVDGSED